ncbi:hypothetical protein KY289_016900 [Solanum tuberosum]|nr:hypothetical protein KY284_016696 [Solanum tuberosum]KAH0689542.1 hypothetical protein KY289_016900 [Solanum tuberosum]
MVVACCCWVSRAHGVEDVRGGFSVSMRRRRKGLFWVVISADLEVSGGCLEVFSMWFTGVSDWRRKMVTFWLEKRGSKGWFGSPELAFGCEVAYKLFSVEVGWIRWVWSPTGKWMMVAVKMEKMGSFRGGCLVAGQQRGE